MINFLKSLFKFETARSENAEFIRLVQIMREDDKFRDFILKVIDQEETKRIAILDNRIEELQSKNAPQEHIDIFSFLKDQSICNKVKEISKHRN